jgi:hypothetical protein
MKFLSIIFLLFTTICITANAQDTAKVRHDAEAMMQATINGDFKTVIKYSYPPLLKSVGGEDKMIAYLEKSLADMKSRNTIVKAVEIGPPGVIVKSRKKLYSVVPEKVSIQSNGVLVYVNSTLVGISYNNGVDWCFIDTGNLSDKQIKQIFPDVYDKLSIPKRPNTVGTIK